MTDEQVTDKMRYFLTNKNFSTFKAIDDGGLVGYALIELNREPLYLKHLYIKPEFRRKGFGSFIVHELLKIFNRSQIEIEAMIWNESAIMFYENFGFKRRILGMRYNK